MVNWKSSYLEGSVVQPQRDAKGESGRIDRGSVMLQSGIICNQLFVAVVTRAWMVANRIAKPAGLAQSAPWIGQAYWGGRGKCILLEVEKLDNYVVTVVITDFPGKIWMRERERGVSGWKLNQLNNYSYYCCDSPFIKKKYGYLPQIGHLRWERNREMYLCGSWRQFKCRKPSSSRDGGKTYLHESWNTQTIVFDYSSYCLTVNFSRKIWRFTPNRPLDMRGTVMYLGGVWSPFNLEDHLPWEREKLIWIFSPNRPLDMWERQWCIFVEAEVHFSLEDHFLDFFFLQKLK